MRSLISFLALIVCAGAAQAHGYGYRAPVRVVVPAPPQVIYTPPQQIIYQPPPQVIYQPAPVILRQEVDYCAPAAVVDYCPPAAVRVNVGQRLFQRQVIRSRNVQKVRGY